MVNTDTLCSLVRSECGTRAHLVLSRRVVHLDDHFRYVADPHGNRPLAGGFVAVSVVVGSFSVNCGSGVYASAAREGSVVLRLEVARWGPKENWDAEDNAMGFGNAAKQPRKMSKPCGGILRV